MKSGLVLGMDENGLERGFGLQGTDNRERWISSKAGTVKPREDAMVINRFEDIQGWQQARVLTNMIFEVSEKGAFSRNFRLRDQIQGAGISIMANIAEGFDCATDAEFNRFLSYAFRSATEVQSHLYVAIDQKFISQQEFDNIYARATETKNLIGGFQRYLRSSPRGKRKGTPQPNKRPESNPLA